MTRHHELADGYVAEFGMKELLNPKELDSVVYSNNLPTRPLFDALEPFLKAQHSKSSKAVVEWLEHNCTIKGHYLHRRKDCPENWQELKRSTD